MDLPIELCGGAWGVRKSSRCQSKWGWQQVPCGLVPSVAWRKAEDTGTYFLVWPDAGDSYLRRAAQQAQGGVQPGPSPVHFSSPAWAPRAARRRAKKCREARWEGAGRGSALETATRLPAAKVLLRPWCKSVMIRATVPLPGDSGTESQMFHGTRMSCLSQRQARSWGAAIRSVGAEPWNKLGSFGSLSSGFICSQRHPLYTCKKKKERRKITENLSTPWFSHLGKQFHTIQKS